MSKHRDDVGTVLKNLRLCCVRKMIEENEQLETPIILMHAALAMWRPARAVCRKLTCRKSQDTKATAKWLFSAIAANAVHFLSFTLPQPDARISSKCKQEYPRIFTADGQVFWMLLLAISGKLLGMKQITVSFNCDFPRALASRVALL